jgi:uncharacterized protein YxeA
MKKILSLILVVVISLTMLVGCDLETVQTDIDKQNEVAETMSRNQSTPTDIDYSLERYNLIRRAYWVNGQREKANNLVCEIEKPLGYVILFSESGAILGRFIVDGKVSSLNSYLTPMYDEKYYANGGVINTELADVDGSYGSNDNGIFFFTPDGKYLEYTGKYLYSDIPFEVENPILKVGTNNE